VWCVCAFSMGRIDIVHEGWLTKKGKVLERWRSSWSELLGLMLCCALSPCRWSRTGSEDTS